MLSVSKIDKWLSDWPSIAGDQLWVRCHRTWDRRYLVKMMQWGARKDRGKDWCSYGARIYEYVHKKLVASMMFWMPWRLICVGHLKDWAGVDNNFGVGGGERGSRIFKTLLREFIILQYRWIGDCCLTLTLSCCGWLFWLPLAFEVRKTFVRFKKFLFDVLTDGRLDRDFRISSLLFEVFAVIDKKAGMRLLFGALLWKLDS